MFPFPPGLHGYAGQAGNLGLHKPFESAVLVHPSALLSQGSLSVSFGLAKEIHFAAVWKFS